MVIGHPGVNRPALRAAQLRRLPDGLRLLGRRRRRSESGRSDFFPIFPGAPGDQGIVEHYDGSAWSIVPSVTEPAPNGGYLEAVTCVSATDCWATGSTTGSSGGAADGNAGGAMERVDMVGGADPDFAAPARRCRY